MNPVTQNLLDQLPGHPITEFVQAWDVLDFHAIQIYRNKLVTPQREAEFEEILSQLANHYPKWQVPLETHWRSISIKGQALLDDPFRKLINLSANDWVDNWQAMQTLPAAREALNNLLVEMIEDMG
ncbi:MAG: hypothetical protein DWQ07_11940 [Chloroflexi bacterium]|nr:MAG: hypothetical protein DWQ07_11940 [Chloroflexota bacterium]MBL1196070.1 hypothetical protein [Chloroflexota bacterium]NOH13364.1 hypothetical protein [Chloroflexota bacterium]